MKKAIQTKYLSATNYRDARVKATAARGLSETISYDYELDADDNHKAAALALASRLRDCGGGWQGSWIGGASPDGKGYCFVSCPLTLLFDSDETDQIMDFGFHVFAKGES